MSKDIKAVINEISKLENFNLKTYYNYVEKYGNEFMLKVFNEILTSSTDVETVFDKYFDVYFSIELEEMEIDDNTYIKLANTYGEDRVNSYFNTLLEVNNNSLTIKQKYESIYFYIDTLENSKQAETFDLANANLDDHVRLYLKEIGTYELLTVEEETTLLEVLNNSRKNLEIGYCDELDNIALLDAKKLVASIRTKEQFKKLKKFAEKLVDNDREVVETYISNMKKVFKENEIIEINAEECYDEVYLNKQLDLIVNFISSKEKLINANLRLVVSIAKHHAYSGTEILDLISEGNMGLMKAIRRFNCEKRTRLSTYATWWIRQGITRYIADCTRTIRVPVHYNERISKYNQALKRLTIEYGQEPTDEMLAEYLGYTLETIQNIKNIIYTSTCVSLDGFIGEEEDTSIIDMIADEKTTEDFVFQTDLGRIFEEVLSEFPEREREVIKYRYGFYEGGRIFTLEEIGQKYGVTRERIRQIENKAIRKLRHVSKARKFRDYV